jgi:prepilin-type N-terminal cleavage/methylation domain-containing protein
MGTNGFSLIEAVISVAIIGISLTALFGLQSIVFRQVIGAYEQTNRIFPIKKIIVEQSILPSSEREAQEQKAIKEPRMKIQLERKKASEEGAFKQFNNIYVVSAIGTWSGIAGKHQETMLRLIYKPEEKKKKE